MHFPTEAHEARIPRWHSDRKREMEREREASGGKGGRAEKREEWENGRKQPISVLSFAD